MILSFEEYRQQRSYRSSALEEEFLRSFSDLCLNEGAFWGATKKFIKSMWSKMVTVGAVALGPTTMNKIKDEVASWEKEPGLVKAENFNVLKGIIDAIIKGSKSDIKEDHVDTGILTESDTDVLSDYMITIDEAHKLFRLTKNRRGMALLEQMNEDAADAVEKATNPLLSLGFIGGWLAGAKIAAVMGWASSFWSAVFVKGIIAQAVVHGGVGNAALTAGSMIGGSIVGVVSLGGVLMAIATLIVAGEKILAKIRKAKTAK